MTTDNERFKVILHDARLISLSKFQMVEAKFGATNADLIALSKEIDTSVGLFNDPAVWVSPIPFEEEEITTYLVKIDASDPNDLPQYLKLMRDFLAYLKNKVLKASSDVRKSVSISDFNLKVLDALNIAQRNVVGRKQFFKNKGIDLDAKPQFITLQKAQSETLSAYRSVLNNNQVQSTELDVMLFKRIGEGIKQATQVQPFMNFYGMLTTSMKSKIPQQV
ncbi:MAG: hypothetical protein JNK77_20940 [Saprospiraceae bacterium]|nr:hypothetical protein [Saprospiraceae bacterium]